jgi:hypothetical protein
MNGLKAFGRGILALIIVMEVSWPSFARAMPMQTGQMHTKMGMSIGCNHPCGDHQSNNPLKNKSSDCAMAVCTAPALIAPASFSISSIMFYPVAHEVVGVTFPLGHLRIPDPYPPRRLPII